MIHRSILLLTRLPCKAAGFSFSGTGSVCDLRGGLQIHCSPVVASDALIHCPGREASWIRFGLSESLWARGQGPFGFAACR
jgi:hypothetical protein